MSTTPHDSLPSPAAWLTAQATYPLLFATFVGVSGGLHPDAAGVASTVTTGAVLVALANLPWLVHLARRWPAAPTRWPPPRGTAGFVARLAFAAWALHAIAVNGNVAARHGRHGRHLHQAPSAAVDAGSLP